MFITGNYFTKSSKRYKCDFYMIYQDYLQTQMSCMKDLSLLLQRFARELGEKADLTVPFLEDIEKTNYGILKKNWTSEQLKIIQNTPGMLMINVEFAEFDPQLNEWLYFSFQGENNLKGIEELLKELAEIIQKEECDIFKKAYEIKRKKLLKELSDAIEVKPQLTGISVDLKEAIKLIKEIRKNSRK